VIAVVRSGDGKNTNGLLRQYMPKGADLFSHSAEDLVRIQLQTGRLTS
jgi:IS30 family transposase